MSVRSSDDDSRPGRKETSQRNTSRDVPAAKFKDGSVGTVAPRGLRGPSLLPGQGAPERINPEEVELAVLRDAETLDGPHVARVAARRLPDPRAPSPTPGSVEVPRVRSIPPALDEYPSTPPSPSARSIQSGTLMSIGSVDPRAPTELSLPSPRPLSVSERAAYLGPEAVVDRTPASAPRELPEVVESSRYRDDPQRPGAPSSQPLPNSSPRSVPVGSGASSSARPSLRPDSVSPPAQKFARPARSYSPVSPPTAYAHSLRDSRPELSSSRGSLPSSTDEAPPQFQIHADLNAVPRQFRDDAFDLRSASTQREPLASRKPLPSTDWSAHGPASERAQPEPSSRRSRHSFPGLRDTAPPTTERVVPAQRTAVPLSWVLGAAAFAVLLALIVAWVLRPPGAQDAARPADGRASAAAPTPLQLPPLNRAAPQALPGTADAPPIQAVPSAASARTAASAAKSASAATTRVPVSASAQPVPAASASAVGAESRDPNSKVHQSIY
jgi:hypothetical protein